MIWLKLATAISVVLGVYFGGMAVTYAVCYLRHDGAPADRLSVLSGWYGGDAVIMMVLWPFVLPFQIACWIGGGIASRMGRAFDAASYVRSVATTKAAPQRLRSGQENGLYEGD